MSMPVISIVIVTWNCRDLLIDCLQSIQKNAGKIAHEILVVDNASSDGTVDLLERTYPEVRVIANHENRGFGSASNQGMQASRAALICLLNPDTILTEPDTLVRIVQRMTDHTEIDAAGCRLVFPDGSHQVGDAGAPPTPAAIFSHAFFLSKIAPRQFAGLFLQQGSADPPYGRVGWVCGACAILRRSTFVRTGGFDESYFLYGEDMEWGCRMTQKGMLVAYLPDITILHVQGGTQKGKPVPSTRWIDGVARLYVDFNRGHGWWFFRGAMALGFLLRSIIYQFKAGSHSASEMRVYARHVWGLKCPETN